MSATEKTKNAASQIGGRAKEVAGTAVGNDELKRKGQSQQMTANLKQSFQKLRDAFRICASARMTTFRRSGGTPLMGVPRLRGNR